MAAAAAGEQAVYPCRMNDGVRPLPCKFMLLQNSQTAWWFFTWKRSSMQDISNTVSDIRIHFAFLQFN